MGGLWQAKQQGEPAAKTAAADRPLAKTASDSGKANEISDTDEEDLQPAVKCATGTSVVYVLIGTSYGELATQALGHAGPASIRHGSRLCQRDELLTGLRMRTLGVTLVVRSEEESSKDTGTVSQGRGPDGKGQGTGKKPATTGEMCHAVP